MSDKDTTARKTPSYAVRDQRLLELIEANKIRKPDNEILANIYRRQGDLVAAACEYERLYASGNRSPSVALLHSVFSQKIPLQHLPESEFSPAPFVQFNDFFEREVNQFLLNDAISRQSIFTPTELEGSDKYDVPYRHNLITYELGASGETLRSLVRTNLPSVCSRLNIPAIDIKFIHLKIAAYSNGDYFKVHQDNGLNYLDRKISFIYYFNREPKPYKGGDLLIYDSRFSPRAYVSSLFTRVIPVNNSIIFFPSEYFHEVLPVETDPQDFSASRFTMTGHIG